MQIVKKYLKQNFSNLLYFYNILGFRIVVVVLMSILVGFFDSLGLALFLPLLQFTGESSSKDLGNLNFIKDIFDFFHLPLNISSALFLILLVFLLKGIVVYVASVYKLKTRDLLFRKVRMQMIRGFLNFKYGQFVKTDLGRIQNLFLGEVGRLQNTYDNYINMAQSVVMIAVYVFFSVILDWKFAILVCLGGLFSNVIFKQIFKQTKEKSKDFSNHANEFSNTLLQYINNFKYLRATGYVHRYNKRAEHSIEKILKVVLDLGILNAKVASFREPLLIGIICLVLFVQVTFFKSNISDLIISLLFFYRSLIAIIGLQNNYNATLANQGAIDNLISFQKELDENQELDVVQSEVTFKKELTVKGLNFYYGKAHILKDINLNIQINTTTAFVGESGSGKTTLVNIINKLIVPQEGKVCIDGIDLKDLNTELYQQKIGYISQEPVIFSDTIFNNVTFWDEPTQENTAKFNEALRKASIHDFVCELELQDQTLLGNNGINLSGGQRQRISIARELYKNVSILILDEATSALDSETEKNIQESIDELKGTLTILVIAHRLSTIRNADQIYFLDKGAITASGNFDTLVEVSTKFKNMVHLQEI